MPRDADRFRPCPACGRPYDPARIPPPRVPLGISCACCCPPAECSGRSWGGAFANDERDGLADWPGAD